MPSSLVANPQNNPYGPQITFRTENVLPPTALYLSPQDGLALDVVCPSAPATVLISYRLLNPNGELVSNTNTYTFPALPNPQAVTIPPVEGYLLGVTIRSNAVARGQVFVRLFTVQGDINAGGTLQALLIQGYPTQNTRLSFPQSPIEADTSGHGWVKGLTFAAPAPGVDFVTAVPPGVRWRLVSLQSALSTSAAVAARLVALAIVAPVNLEVGVQSSGVVQPASAALFYSWFDGAVLTNAGGFVTAPSINGLFIPPGWTIGTGTENLQAGDQWSQTVMFVEEWASLN